MLRRAAGVRLVSSAHMMGERTATSFARRHHDIEAVTRQHPDRCGIDVAAPAHRRRSRRAAPPVRAAAPAPERAARRLTLQRARRAQRGQPQHRGERLEAGEIGAAARAASPSSAASSARRNSLGSVMHPSSARSSRSRNGRRVGRLDMRAGMIDEMHVIDAGRAGGHAGEAGQAAVDMLDHLAPRRLAVLQHVLDQIDAAARRIDLVAEQHIGRAGRGAEAAMDASAQDLVRLPRYRDRPAGRG